MIRDRALKAQILRYAVGRRWFPQLEVDVTPRSATAESEASLTDIDVLVSMPDDFEGFREMFVECTTGQESAIARALWLRGLMDQLGAARGLCIVGRDKIEPDHRYNAAALGVILVTKDELAQYTAATGEKSDASQSHVANIELWERFFGIGAKFPPLKSSIEFCTSDYWMSRSDSDACRKVVAEAMRIRPEMDPAKTEHLALACDLAALFVHSLASIVARTFASYLQPKNRDELSEALLALLYGGRENYEHLNSLRKLIAVPAGAQNGRSLQLPEWDRFLQLVRHGLDTPTELPYAALLLKEMGWNFLNNSSDLAFAKTLAAEKRQAAKMALLAVEYISYAGNFPPEFASLATRTAMEVQQPPAKSSLRS